MARDSEGDAFTAINSRSQQCIETLRGHLPCNTLETIPKSICNSTETPTQKLSLNIYEVQ